MCSTKTCPHYKEDKPLIEFYTRRDGNQPSSYCKVCTNLQSRTRQQALKSKAVEYKGGCCSKCGYDKYIGALEFHHLDPKEKDFNISTCKTYSFKRIRPELDKCVLLCSNCHREAHATVEEAEWLPSAASKGNKEFEDVELDSYQKPKNKTKIEWPSDEELKDLVWKFPRTHLSKVFKVSDKAIANYLNRIGIDQPPRGYWARLRSKSI